jgi:hypothetical protein
MSITVSPYINTKKRAKVHYVNNADFLAALVAYKENIAAAKEANKPIPRVPNYIGECLTNIATRLSRKFNFTNYSYREEMVGDGIENCLIYLNNFDPNKSSNPFAYFTQIIYFAFLRRIQKEKKQTYIKHKVFEREMMHLAINDQQAEETPNIVSNVKVDTGFIDGFVVDFENKLLLKKNAAKIKLTKEVIDSDE